MKSHNMKRHLLVVALLSSLLLASSSLANSLSSPFKKAIKKVNPAVVYIEVRTHTPVQAYRYGRVAPAQREAIASGSGVVIDAKRGYILTAAHVVKDVDQATVTLPDSREFDVIDIRTDPQTDVAIVQIDADGLTQVPFGDSDALEVGDWVLAMGAPLGKTLANSVSAGIVSGKERKTSILGKLGIEDYIQTDAVINKGNSGGPLVNIDGEIVGINSSIISASGMSAGLGFAVPSNLIKPVVKELIEEGSVVRGWIGVSISSLSDIEPSGLCDIPEEIKEHGGAYILGLLQDGPADLAGLENGDIITKINSKEIKGANDLIRLISSMKPDDVIKCKVYRDEEVKEIEVTLGTRPSSGESHSFSSITNDDRESASYKKLGIVVEDFNNRMFGPRGTFLIDGVRVKYVKSGSLAKEYGLNTSDIIVAVDGAKFNGKEEFENLINIADIKYGIVLTIRGRDGLRKLIIRDTVR